jgi:two-component system CheB/CheR fusion protein
MSTPDSDLQSFLASIVESSDDAIVSKTLNGLVTSWNRAAERIFGYTADEMIGRPISVLAVPEHYEDMRRILETIRRGERIDHYETVRRTKDGRIIHVSLTVSPIRDAQGKIVGASKIARDITDRKFAEAARIQAEERLRLALEAGRMVAWDLDLTTGAVGSPLECLEQPGGGAGLLSGPIPPVHPDDVERVERALRLAITSDAPYDIEYRHAAGHGAGWVNDRAVVLRDEQGAAARVLGIRTDITDRKRAEQENASLLEEVRKAVEQRDEFLAMLAHELRNPLAPLKNAIHLLRLKGDDPSVVDRVRDMMDRQVTHLGRLVNDLLDVSRLTRGMVVLDRRRGDLARLVEQAAEDHRGTFEAAGVSLEVDVPETPVWVSVDQTRLVQVLDNLLENARKFSERGGRIGVQLVADRPAARAILTVRDTGIGVEPEMLSRLFDVFTQADRSLDRRRGGLGLGLALVKRLVELHGGEVEAKSPGLGLGSQFIVTLPLEEEPTALTDQSPRDPGPRKQVRVLVVEDNRDSAESLRMLLSSQGYDVTLAFSGTEGVELAHRARPDVVVCDIGLPGMDGYAVARALRNDPGTRRVRLIAVTGYGQEGDRSRALESGFDTHLVKPADPESLLSLIF